MKHSPDSKLVRSLPLSNSGNRFFPCIQWKTVAAAFVAIALTGCGTKTTAHSPSSASATSSVASASAAPVTTGVYEFLIDFTGSYGHKQDAIKESASTFRSYAQPNETWVFRTIGPKSYTDLSNLLSVRVPSRPNVDTSNVLDYNATRKARLADARWRRVVNEAADALASVRPPDMLKGTDLDGAFAKMGEIMSAAPQDARKVAVVFSDMGDTLQRPGSVDLKGVTVIFVLVEDSADIQASQQLKQRWSKKLKEWGATVIFYDTSMGSLGEVVTGRRNA